ARIEVPCEFGAALADQDVAASKRPSSLTHIHVRRIVEDDGLLRCSPAFHRFQLASGGLAFGMERPAVGPDLSSIIKRAGDTGIGSDEAAARQIQLFDFY